MNDMTGQDYKLLDFTGGGIGKPPSTPRWTRKKQTMPTPILQWIFKKLNKLSPVNTKENWKKTLPTLFNIFYQILNDHMYIYVLKHWQVKPVSKLDSILFTVFMSLTYNSNQELVVCWCYKVVIIIITQTD